MPMALMAISARVSRSVWFRSATGRLPHLGNVREIPMRGEKGVVRAFAVLEPPDGVPGDKGGAQPHGDDERGDK